MIYIDKQELMKIKEGLNKLYNSLSDQEILESIALNIKNKILLRTGTGLDFNMVPFKAYNPAYKAQQKKTIVNLTLSGEMLNSMTQTAVSNDAVKIFFLTESARKKAKIHNIEGAGKNKVIREFFGVNSQDENNAVKTYEHAMQAAIQEFNRYE